jgi:hypothetical protein
MLEVCCAHPPGNEKGFFSKLIGIHPLETYPRTVVLEIQIEDRAVPVGSKTRARGPMTMPNSHQKPPCLSFWALS